MLTSLQLSVLFSKVSNGNRTPYESCEDYRRDKSDL